jgi:hypothetical protein
MDYSGACEIRHDYTIEEIFELGPGGTFEPCGDGCVLWTVGSSFPTGPCYQELTGTLRILKPEAILGARLEELWYEDYIAGLWIDGTNHYSHTAGDCENDDSPTVRLGHDVSAYFQTEGEKRVLLALIQGGDLGGGTVRIRIRFDPSYALVADTWEDDPPCLDLVSAIDDGACEEDEFELGVKRELKSCHYVGSYCKSKVLTACIERRKAYCCFNSPLARILDE